jgi:hypothetical protein
MGEFIAFGSVSFIWVLKGGGQEGVGRGLGEGQEGVRRGSGGGQEGVRKV